MTSLRNNTPTSRIAAQHHGTAFLHQADRKTSKRVCPPGGVGRNAVPEKFPRDAAISFTAEMPIERPKHQLQPPPPVRGEARRPSFPAPRHGPPDLAGRVEPILEHLVQREDL
jgi:hypothetical protein